MAWYEIYPPSKSNTNSAAPPSPNTALASAAAAQHGPSVLAAARNGNGKARRALAAISTGARRGNPASAAALLSLRASWRQMSTRSSSLGRPLGLYQRGLITSFLHTRG